MSEDGNLYHQYIQYIQRIQDIRLKIYKIDKIDKIDKIYKIYNLYHPPNKKTTTIIADKQKIYELKNKILQEYIDNLNHISELVNSLDNDKYNTYKEDFINQTTEVLRDNEFEKSISIRYNKYKNKYINNLKKEFEIFKYIHQDAIQKNNKIQLYISQKPSDKRELKKKNMNIKVKKKKYKNNLSPIRESEEKESPNNSVEKKESPNDSKEENKRLHSIVKSSSSTTTHPSISSQPVSNNINRIRILGTIFSIKKSKGGKRKTMKNMNYGGYNSNKKSSNKKSLNSQKISNDTTQNQASKIVSEKSDNSKSKRNNSLKLRRLSTPFGNEQNKKTSRLENRNYIDQNNYIDPNIKGKEFFKNFIKKLFRINNNNNNNNNNKTHTGGRKRITKCKSRKKRKTRKNRT
jgi:hypothetical protein